MSRTHLLPRSGLLLLTLAALAACTGGGLNPGVPITPGGPGVNWSDPQTWGGKVPDANSAVTIPEGKTVVLDASAAVASVTVYGTLAWADKDGLELKARWVMVHGPGKFQIGSEAQPFTKRATLTLTGPKTDEDVMGMGTKFLGVMSGGRAEFYGEPRTAWTRLAATAPKGATRLTLAENPSWRAGDRLVVASTDFDMNQAEEVTVTSASGATVDFTPALKYSHFGQIQTFGGRPVDSRAEVALLNRSVVIQGEEASSKDGFGGHVMVMSDGVGRFVNVEFTRMGQKAILRRYALHYHLLFDKGQDSHLKNSSLHHTFNRCVVVHGTNKLLLERNTCYDNVGHAFFLEDGSEVENRFVENLGLLTRRPPAAEAVIKADAEPQGPATFWITNPRNTFRGNVAAGSDGTGFWFSMPGQVTGLVGKTYPGKYPSPIAEWKTDFVDNVGHSNGTAFFQDGCLKDDGSTQTCYYYPIREQAEALGTEPKPSDPRLRVEFGGFTAYKNGLGVWTRSMYTRFKDVRLADNGTGMILASNEVDVQGGVIAGETENKGNPKPGERTGPFGNSLPNPGAREFDQRLQGYAYYDGPHHLSDLVFANFRPGKLSDGTARPVSAALSFNTGTQAGHTAKGLRFVDTPDAHRVSIGFGNAQFTFEDLDGSVAGQPAAVSGGAGSMVDAACAERAGWGWYGASMTVCPRASGKYRYIDLWWYDGDYPGGNIPVSVTRQGGGTFTRDYETRLKLDIGVTSRVAFKNGGMSPDSLLRFGGLRPGEAYRLEIPYNQAPASVVFGGAYFGPLQNVTTPVTAAPNAALTAPNTYFWDAGQKVLHLHLKPHYLDYAFNEGSANLRVR